MIARSAVLEAGDALLPRRDSDRPVFDEAWEAQAFAMVVVLHDAKLFSWSEWTAALAREIAADTPMIARPGTPIIVIGSTLWNASSRKKEWPAPLLLMERKAAWRRAAEATPHGRPILLANDPDTPVRRDTRAARAFARESRPADIPRNRW